jgi:hypothetical protein
MDAWIFNERINSTPRDRILYLLKFVPWSSRRRGGSASVPRTQAAVVGYRTQNVSHRQT